MPPQTRATLVSNFGNFYAVAIGSLFISFLPMLPKQLLLLNLLPYFPMMAIVFDRVSDQEVAQPQRYDFRSLYIVFVTLGLVSTVSDFIYFGLFYRISPDVLQTNWFIASVITELLLMASIRSMLPMIPWTSELFGFTRPSTAHMMLIFSLALLYLIISKLAKRPIARFLSKV